MLEIRTNVGYSYFFIVTNGDRYLHCDGRILDVCEYFETKEDAQAVLDKFYPKPEHVWEHGDVFSEEKAGLMIYMNAKYSEHGPQVFYIRTDSGYSDLDTNGPVQSYLEHAKFLYNIREKI